MKVTEHAMGFGGHLQEALESWQRVEGRRFFVVCFALLLFASLTMYWQLRHVQSSLNHLHGNVALLTQELEGLRAALVHKKGGRR